MWLLLLVYLQFGILLNNLLWVIPDHPPNPPPSHPPGPCTLETTGLTLSSHWCASITSLFTDSSGRNDDRFNPLWWRDCPGVSLVNQIPYSICLPGQRWTRYDLLIGYHWQMGRCVSPPPPPPTHSLSKASSPVCCCVPWWLIVTENVVQEAKQFLLLMTMWQHLSSFIVSLQVVVRICPSDFSFFFWQTVKGVISGFFSLVLFYKTTERSSNRVWVLKLGVWVRLGLGLGLI